MTEHITVSRELLRQVIDAACSPYCAQDLGKLIPSLRAALEQPAVEPTPKPTPSDCTGCSNTDSWGLPDKPVCRRCVSGSAWVPLNHRSVNLNKITAPQAQQPAVEPVAEASVLELAEQLKAGAAFPAYPPMPLIEAARVLLKQHEEIVQLREALRMSAAAPQAQQAVRQKAGLK